MHILKLLLAAAVLTALAGCTTLQQVVNDVGVANTVLTQVKAYYADAPKTVFALRGGYDIALGAAAMFKTTVCSSITSKPFCATVVPELRAGNHKALAALDVAENYVRTHPTLDPASAIAAAQAAVTAFAQVETTNGVAPK